MDFARKQLLKYGWEEGKGLGKAEDGIAEALRPALKFDKAGVGHDGSEQFTHNWWESVYNQAADNMQVTTLDSGEVSFGLKSGRSIHISNKKDNMRFLDGRADLQYGSFLKTSRLTAEGTVDCEDRVKVAADEDGGPAVVNLTDEQLLAACGGRTAHKGARHGLQLSGKLARIEEQERQLLQHMEATDTVRDPRNQRRQMLRKKKRERKQLEAERPELSTVPDDEAREVRQHIRKEKKALKQMATKLHRVHMTPTAEDERLQQRRRLKNQRKRLNRKLGHVTDLLDRSQLEEPEEEVHTAPRKKRRKGSRDGSDGCDNL